MQKTNEFEFASLAGEIRFCLIFMDIRCRGLNIIRGHFMVCIERLLVYIHIRSFIVKELFSGV